MVGFFARLIFGESDDHLIFGNPGVFFGEETPVEGQMGIQSYDE